MKIKVDDSDLIKLEDRLQRIANLMKQMCLIEEDKTATSSWLSSVKVNSENTASTEAILSNAKDLCEAGMHLGVQATEYDPGISNVDLNMAINELKIAVVSHLLDIKHALLDIKHKSVH
ncbi:hypothetical protein [Arsenophonus nasoniae]|uniref:Uncharacterized protein n=1 Tax=Arsenophonus nasoniae TaxID=638 RepID=A0AA95GML4_9GAMM|nr:hypothetical protein [Arsenophonus nasoniae]WGM01773.1 hypothetical protein QE210_01190 [Arsenophonus nasoniae]